jgi:hypothetical protein
MSKLRVVRSFTENFAISVLCAGDVSAYRSGVGGCLFSNQYQPRPENSERLFEVSLGGAVALHVVAHEGGHLIRIFRTLYILWMLLHELESRHHRLVFKRQLRHIRVRNLARLDLDTSLRRSRPRNTRS